jgi:methionyl-tRNA formyltransferase
VAKRYGLPCVCLDDLLSVGSMKMLKALQADLGIVAAIELYLPKQLVEAFTCGCIGIHSSLLTGTRWVLNGDRKAAINVHRITDRPYSSPLLVQRETMIKPGETWAELHFGLSCIACDALNTTISMLEEKPMTSLNFKSIFGCVP